MFNQNDFLQKLLDESKPVNLSFKEINEMIDLPKKINHLLQQASLLPLEKETVDAKIAELSDNALLGLKQAIKQKELHRIFSILGIDFSKKTKVKKENNNG